MPLQPWINEWGHFFVDSELGGVQVGQAWQDADGLWTVEVNDNCVSAPDLESATHLFIERYDRSLVRLSPLSDCGGANENDFQIVDLR